MVKVVDVKQTPEASAALPPHLAALEAEAIHIFREAMADAQRPVLLFSGGKDSTVLAHLAVAAFHPSPAPMPLLHIDSTFEFAETIKFRDDLAEAWGFDLIVRRNEEGAHQQISPFTHGSALYTEVMRTVPLKAALDELRSDVVFGGRVGTRRSRGPRSVSFRSARWVTGGSRARSGPSSGASSIPAWGPARRRGCSRCRTGPKPTSGPMLGRGGCPWRPLYFAARRPTVVRDGDLLVVGDERYPFEAGEAPVTRHVRFRTVGCWPVTGAIESAATTLPEVLMETLSARFSERKGRLIDTDDGGSLESKKRQGYF